MSTKNEHTKRITIQLRTDETPLDIAAAELQTMKSRAERVRARVGMNNAYAGFSCKSDDEKPAE